MFTINSFAAVVYVAKTFSAEALDYAIMNGTISSDACQTIRDCKRWAAETSFEIENVNDGNIEYRVDAHFTSEKVGTEYCTSLKDITIIRTGFGSYSVTVYEAMEKGYINSEILASIMYSINERNDASRWLFN